MRTAAAEYAGASLLHSLMTMGAPLLSLPFAFAARPIVLCFTIVEPASRVVLERLGDPESFADLPIVQRLPEALVELQRAVAEYC